MTSLLLTFCFWLVGTERSVTNSTLRGGLLAQLAKQLFSRAQLSRVPSCQLMVACVICQGGNCEARVQRSAGRIETTRPRRVESLTYSHRHRGRNDLYVVCIAKPRLLSFQEFSASRCAETLRRENISSVAGCTYRR